MSQDHGIRNSPSLSPLQTSGERDVLPGQSILHFAIQRKFLPQGDPQKRHLIKYLRDQRISPRERGKWQMDRVLQKESGTTTTGTVYKLPVAFNAKTRSRPTCRISPVTVALVCTIWA